MGWVLSPPVFYATSETTANRANEQIWANWRRPLHRFDTVANMPTLTARLTHMWMILFSWHRGKQKRRRVLFHCLDKVFCPPDKADNKWKKDPNFVKKPRKGDRALEKVKVVLGWLIDIVVGTIKLLPHCLKKLLNCSISYPGAAGCAPSANFSNSLASSEVLSLHNPRGREVNFLDSTPGQTSGGGVDSPHPSFPRRHG